jgi:MFS family permease
MTLDQKAQKNLDTSIWVHALQKRIFLPFIALYFTKQGGASVGQLSLAAAVAVAVNLLLQIPTGYFADKHGSAASIKLGTLLVFLGVSSYAISPSIPSMYIGFILEYSGYSFISGAKQSMTHDSLRVLGRVSEFKSFTTGVVRKSLLSNAIFLSFAGVLWSINNRLPFIAGAVLALIMFYKSLGMQNVGHTNTGHQSINKALRVFNKKVFIVILLISLINGSISGLANISWLGIGDVGTPVIIIPWVVAISSLIGFFSINLVERVQRYSTVRFAVIDTIISSLCNAVIITRIWPIVFIVMVINLIWFRYRNTYYHSHLFDGYSGEYKSTLISGLSLLTGINTIWIGIAAGILVEKSSVVYGNFVSGLAVLIILPFIILAMRKPALDHD